MSRIFHASIVYFTALLMLVFLSACAATPLPTLTEVPSAVASVTPSITPTVTLTAAPTSTPTQTMTPTPYFTPTITLTPLGGGSGKIVFVARPKSTNAPNEIYIMNTDGSQQKRLTDSYKSADPQLSPDGKKIVFTSFQKSPDHGLYIMNADGSQQTKIFSPDESVRVPQWSPDGTKIVFEHWFKGNLDDAIFVINADGTNPIRLTNNSVPVNFGSDRDPVWSPDGKKILFSSTRDRGSEIYVINADGSQLTRLTTSAGAGDHDWSPDGQKILLTLGLKSSKDSFYIMNGDGSQKICLADLDEIGYRDALHWSPDGKRILFYSNFDICIINANISMLHCPVKRASFFESVSWLPDGKRILFLAYIDSSWEFYTMNIDGTQQTRLKNDLDLDYTPIWEQ